MTIQKNKNGEMLMLKLEGRLDTTTAPQLQEVLLPAFEENFQVELDFSGLVYVSSAGLRVLLLGEKTAKGKGGVMSITHVSPEVMEVFDITGFTDILTIA